MATKCRKIRENMSPERQERIQARTQELLDELEALAAPHRQ